MLNLLRKGGFSQVIMGAVVAAVILVFVVQFRAGSGAPTAALTRECVVRTGSRCVPRKDFDTAFSLLVPRGMQPKDVRKLKLTQVVTEGLIERELLLAEAERLGVTISDDEVDKELQLGRAHVSVPVAEVTLLGYVLGIGADMVRHLPVTSTATGQFDYDIYSRVVRSSTRRSPKEFKALQKTEMIAARVRQLAASRVRVSEAEAFSAFEREKSKAVARVAHLDATWFEKYAADVSDAAVDAWAREHATQVDDAWKVTKDSWKAGCPLVGEIVAAAPGTATDAEKTAAHDKIAEAEKRIRAGEPFDVVARNVSEGQAAVLGGELGCLGESYGPGAKELIEAAAKLKVGEVSPVIESPAGFHLLRSAGTLAATDVEALGRRVVARRLAVGFRGDELAQKLGQDLVKAAQEGKKLEDAVKELAAAMIAPGAGGKTRPSGAAAKAAATDLAPLEAADRPRVEITAALRAGDSPVPDALPGESPAAIVLSLQKADDVHPKLVKTAGGYAVLQLKEKTAATQEEFQTDKDSVMRGLAAAKRAETLVLYIARLRQAEKKIQVSPRLAEEEKEETGD